MLSWRVKLKIQAKGTHKRQVGQLPHNLMDKYISAGVFASGIPVQVSSSDKILVFPGLGVMTLCW